jgi:hypothetical protein
LSVDVELVTHQLNHRRLPSLGRQTRYQVYHDPARRIQLHGASRQRIFREVFEPFWPCAGCVPERNPHTINTAWRLVVETWLRHKGWIIRDGKTTIESVNQLQAFFVSELVLHYNGDCCMDRPGADV